MTREDIIRMADEAGIFMESDTDHWYYELGRFAALVAAAERKTLMQLFTDPENQPTQHGTVTIEYMQQEIAAEREACAKLIESRKTGANELMDAVRDMEARAIRARGQA